MKQSKRFLSVLLAMLMTLSLFTVGANAIRADYSEPAGYDSIMTPYFTNEQAATALLDLLDGILADVDVDESYVGIDIKIKSVDTTFDTVQGIFDKVGFLAGLAGDVRDLDIDAIDNNIRRRNNYTDLQVFMAFCQFAADNGEVLSRLVDNSIDLGVVGWFLDLGEEAPMLNNLHGYLCDMIYKLLVDENGNGSYTEGSKTDSYNLDNILQDWLNNRVLTFVLNLLDDETVETVVNFLGIQVQRGEDGKISNQMGLLTLLPSLSANDISITTTSTYDFIINIFNALIDDIVIPFGGKLLIELLDIDPNDPNAEELSYVDIAIGLFVDASVLKEAGAVPADTPDNEINVTEEFLRWQGVSDPAHPMPLEKINVTLEYILHTGIKRFIHFVGIPGVNSHLELTEYFNGLLKDLIRSIIPMLPALASDFAPVTAEEEAALATMSEEEMFAFLAKMLLNAFVDGVYFPDDCKTIKGLATYTLMNMCEEMVHDDKFVNGGSPLADFQAQIDAGTLDPDSDDCLKVAASVINYYLTGLTTFESSNPAPEFNELLDDAYETFAKPYASLFKIYQNDTEKQLYSHDPWFKLYRTVNAWIPLTNLFYNYEETENGIQLITDSPDALEALLMDNIIGNVLDFDINGLLGIIGRRPDSDLNKPFSKLVANLLARILNGVFQLPTELQNQAGNNSFQKSLIVPYDYTTLDQIITINNTSGSINGCGLKHTAQILLESLPNICRAGGVAAEALNTIATLVGVIDTDDFDYMKRQYANNGAGSSYTINELKALYEELKIPDNEGLKYYDDNYEYVEMVDYRPWAFEDYEDALDNAADIINAFDNNLNPSRADITYAYYCLQRTYEDFLIDQKPDSTDYYLAKFMAANPRVNENIDPDTGDLLYTNRSWDDYVKAYDFAQKVTNEFAQYKAQMKTGDYPQSKINMARAKLRDAIHGLKLNAGLGDADYTELLNALETLTYLNSPSTFTDKSVQAVVAAYNEALAFVREVWYDADSQVIVDGVAARLNDAYAQLQNIPLLQSDMGDGSYEYSDIVTGEYIMGQFVTDEVTGYVYGLPHDMYNEAEQEDCGYSFTNYLAWYLWASTTENCTEADIAPTATGNGTGAKIKLLSDDDGDGVFKTEREYTVIYFGDVTGDTNFDGMDAVILRAYAARMLQVNNKTAYINIAGDADADTFLSNDDAKLLDKCGVAKDTVSQDPTSRLGDPIAFTDIVNQ